MVLWDRVLFEEPKSMGTSGRVALSLPQYRFQLGGISVKQKGVMEIKISTSMSSDFSAKSELVREATK
jgi:hypothetical protein